MNLIERISEIITNFKADPMVLLNLEDCSMFTEKVFELNNFKTLSLKEFEMKYTVLLLIAQPSFSMTDLSDFYDLFPSNTDESENDINEKAPIIGVSISESTERETVYMFTKN